MRPGNRRRSVEPDVIDDSTGDGTGLPSGAPVALVEEYVDREPLPDLVGRPLAC